MTDAGLLRERVVFQQRGLDEHGDRLGAWEDGFSVAARVFARRGSEPVIQARLQGVQPLEVTIRSQPATRRIGTDWRMVWQGRNHNIRSIAPDETRQFIALMAEQDQSDA